MPVSCAKIIINCGAVTEDCVDDDSIRATNEVVVQAGDRRSFCSRHYPRMEFFEREAAAKIPFDYCEEMY